MIHSQRLLNTHIQCITSLCIHVHNNFYCYISCYCANYYTCGYLSLWEVQETTQHYVCYRPLAPHYMNYCVLLYRDDNMHVRQEDRSVYKFRDLGNFTLGNHG